MGKWFERCISTFICYYIDIVVVSCVEMSDMPGLVVVKIVFEWEGRNTSLIKFTWSWFWAVLDRLLWAPLDFTDLVFDRVSALKLDMTELVEVHDMNVSFLFFLFHFLLFWFFLGFLLIFLITMFVLSSIRDIIVLGLVLDSVLSVSTVAAVMVDVFHF